MEQFDAVAVQAWARAAAAALEAARGPIDSLNVFPVADADTGTNLFLTIEQGADEVDARAPHPSAASAMRAFARGALLGARGNSGVIASQFLLGLARSLPDPGVPDAAALAAALDDAQRAARAAIAAPVEGTILTAATAAAVSARGAAGAGAEVGPTALAALRGAREALARTTDELAVLRAARVVDAGAAGLVVILEALVTVVTGRAAPGSAPIAARVVSQRGAPDAPDAPDDRLDDRLDDGSDGTFGAEFEVMYLVEAAAPGVEMQLSARLQALGESVAVVGGPDVWHVHVHTGDPAAAVAAGALGVQRQVTVRHLRQQVADHAAAAASAAALPPGPAAPDRIGVVVGTRAPALIRELARAGAVVMVLSGAAASAAGVVRAVIDSGAAQVAVLPGSPDARAAALAAARTLGAGRPSVPGRSRGTAGVQVHVFDADDEVHVIAGLAAAVAARSAPAAPGGGNARALDPTTQLAAIARALAAVRAADVVHADADDARRVADALLAAGGDVLTMLRGAGAGDAVLAPLLAHLERAYPALEVVVLDGGQASPALALAVE